MGVEGGGTAVGGGSGGGGWRGGGKGEIGGSRSFAGRWGGGGGGEERDGRRDGGRGGGEGAGGKGRGRRKGWGWIRGLSKGEVEGEEAENRGGLEGGWRGTDGKESEEISLWQDAGRGGKGGSEGVGRLRIRRREDRGMGGEREG